MVWPLRGRPAEPLASAHGTAGMGRCRLMISRNNLLEKFAAKYGAAQMNGERIFSVLAYVVLICLFLLLQYSCSHSCKGSSDPCCDIENPPDYCDGFP